MICRSFPRLLSAMTGLGLIALSSHAQQSATNGADDTRAVVQRACGNCHGLDTVLGVKKTKDEWTTTVKDMISKGAQVSPPEFAQIVDYLGDYTPPVQSPQAPRGTTGPTQTGPIPKQAGRPGGPGPLDRHVVEAPSAVRGRSLYIAECGTCHGADGRGASGEAPPAQQGPDLVRSVVLAHDRYGNALGPFLKNSHHLQSGKSGADLSEEKILDLSNFLHKQLDDTLIGGAYTHVLNVLTGDPKAGEAYFNGAGECNTCHSPTGDLASIATRYDPPALQQQFIFPRTISRDNKGRMTSPKPVTLTVVLPNGMSVSGVLDHLDDFSVSLTDSSGKYHAWTRTSALKVEKHDPYQAHIDLLDRITDKEIHNVLAYLETLR